MKCMKHQLIGAFALAAGIAWTTASLAGQASAATAKAAAKAPAKTWTMPRTPWGDPDLEGLWPGTDFVGVPLQRPDGLGTRNELTDAEFAIRLANFQKQS